MCSIMEIGSIVFVFRWIMIVICREMVFGVVEWFLCVIDWIDPWID